MALIQTFEKEGNFLFKYRGQFPILLFLMAIPLILFTSSTAIDRILIYWLPLQLFVYGNIPVAYLRNKYIYAILYFMIVLYSFLVFAVWFYFSNNSYKWVPYSNYLWL